MAIKILILSLMMGACIGVFAAPQFGALWSVVGVTLAGAAFMAGRRQR